MKVITEQVYSGNTKVYKYTVLVRKTLLYIPLPFWKVIATKKFGNMSSVILDLKSTFLDKGFPLQWEHKGALDG